VCEGEIPFSVRECCRDGDLPAAVAHERPGLGLVRRERVGNGFRDDLGWIRIRRRFLRGPSDSGDLLAVQSIPVRAELLLERVQLGARLPKIAVSTGATSISGTGMFHCRSSSLSALLMALIPNFDAL
jgi:hypothetical protein